MGFAEELRNQSAGDWDAAVNHAFVDQLLDGALPDEQLRCGWSGRSSTQR
ncbi:hypothetical protein [Paenarthrobacter sp. 4246]